MNVNLLYADKEWSASKPYYDWTSITKDLGLNAVFKAASQDSIFRNSRAVYAEKEDPFLGLTVRRVMRQPLQTAEEIKYRQDILKDCLKKQAFVDGLYQVSSKLLEDWEKLGRKSSTAVERDSMAKLITDLKVLRLLVDGMSKVHSLFLENIEGINSEGLLHLFERLQEELSEEKVENLDTLMKSMSFYANIAGSSAEPEYYVSRLPRIRIDCSLTDGLKIGDLKLETMETIVKPFKNPNGISAKIRGTLTSLAPGMISLYKDQALQDDAAQLEYQTVNYVYSYCISLVESYGQFFDQLHFQTAFYLGAINIRSQMQRFKIDYCFPQVAEIKDELKYEDLREMVLTIDQEGKTVGNSGSLNGKQLVIITGANQGGKSTFLRSIGIAQVMMQCGLFVAAKSFKSAVCTSLFTHFTRREDSAMNSGRLDEELRRMDQIINNLGEDPLILLNESFATTTEKEGSDIAYGIIKALKEEGVRIFSVTHLLSFAQRMYEESKTDEKVSFLCAEHLEGGKRTFKMIPHAPELTSFGLELYDEVLGSNA
ncbi:MAG: hypothetical protein IKR23_04810 [Lachnospiraceae bacterium]|nr:hypothetical protein [Lachnospiraceae bacterium]